MGEDQGRAGEGAFREGTVRPLCASCHEPTAGTTCPRCGAPLCAAHAPAPRQRCADCEAEYLVLRRDRQVHPVPTWALFAAYLVAAGGVFVGASLIQKLGDVLTPTAGVLFGALVFLAGGAPLYVRAFRRGRLRRLFLAEQPGKRLLQLSRATLEALAAAENKARPKLVGWVLAAIATAYGVGSWAMAVVGIVLERGSGRANGAFFLMAASSERLTIYSVVGVLSGATALVVSLVWVVRGRAPRFAQLAELFWLIVVPAWGLLINLALPACAACKSLPEMNQPFATPSVYGLYAVYGAAVVAYGIARRRPERLRPVAEALVLAQLIVGLGLCAALAVHLHLLGALGAVTGPLGLPLASPAISGGLFLAALIRRLKQRGIEAREGAGRSPLGRVAALGLPLVGLWAVAERLILGTWPLQALFDSCDQNLVFALLKPPHQHCDGHYLCTVAARGHRWLVRPLRVGRRGGAPILVNRQLAVANAFEDLLHERWPRFGRLCRRVYDRLGLPIARHLRGALVADLVYLAMKPFEWLFALALHLLDRDPPERRIDRMYR